MKAFYTLKTRQVFIQCKNRYLNYTCRIKFQKRVKKAGNESREKEKVRNRERLLRERQRLRDIEAERQMQAFFLSSLCKYPMLKC